MIFAGKSKSYLATQEKYFLLMSYSKRNIQVKNKAEMMYQSLFCPDLLVVSIVKSPVDHGVLQGCRPFLS